MLYGMGSPRDSQNLEYNFIASIPVVDRQADGIGAWFGCAYQRWTLLRASIHIRKSRLTTKQYESMRKGWKKKGIRVRTLPDNLCQVV